MPREPYTQEQTDFIKAAWIEGKSATEISVMFMERFGIKKSRNAVIGKVHRENLSRPALKRTYNMIERKKRTPKPKTAKPRAILAPEPNPIIMPRPVVRSAHNVTTIQLKRCNCRWPIEGSGEHMLMCGADASEYVNKGAQPYCEEHQAMNKGKELTRIRLPSGTRPFRSNNMAIPDGW